MVKITTDTTCMYTVSEGKALGIDLVPMTLIAGDKSYREIEEINVDELKVLIEKGVKENVDMTLPQTGEKYIASLHFRSDFKGLEYKNANKKEGDL